MKRTYDHDRDLPEGMHIRQPVLRFVFILLQIDRDVLVRNLKLLANDEERRIKTVDFNDHTEKEGLFVCEGEEKGGLLMRSDTKSQESKTLYYHATLI